MTPDSRTCPDESPSFAWDGKITNRLDVPIRLTVGDYTCDDWSGSSTPGAVMNGQVIPPKGELKVHLEPRKYRTRQWTMSFAIDSGPDLGSARMWMRQAAADNDWSTPDQGAYERTWTFAGNGECAWFLPLQPTGASDTPTSLLPNYPKWMGIVVSRGHIAVVTQAGGGSCESE